MNIKNEVDKKSYIKICEYSHRLLFCLSFLILSGCAENTVSSISLAGTWELRLDSTNIGYQENWFNNLESSQIIELPGTLDDANIGTVSTLEPALNNVVLSSLNRNHEYYGKAWYQKEVEIPKNWDGKDIKLTLERVLWESQVFVDGQPIGKRESLVGSHTYDLSSFLSPGKHKITVVIDNSNKYPKINVLGDRYPDEADKEMAHAYTNHTQIKWNGILGTIALTASDKLSPEDLQIYPDFENNSINVVFQRKTEGRESVEFEIFDMDGTSLISETIDLPMLNDSIARFSVTRPETIKTWDEFSPHLYTAKLRSGNQVLSTVFGYRTIGNKQGDLYLNGRRIFLRGNLECVIFPLTGYPPMQKQAWAELIAQAKNYGLNHLRFHSWCPPEAAFQAADEAGVYLQVELPHWSLEVGTDEATTQFLYAEAFKILQDYGNHPSFIMMAMGNELQGDMAVLNKMTTALKQADPRHLYATTSFSFQKPSGTRPEPEDEFFIAQWTDKGWIRGQGIFNDFPPSFDEDYSENMGHINVPVISHEIGQYSVYPDLSEIPKYTGVLEPLNFMAVKNDLEAKGLLALANHFTQASGKLAAMLYKEEIERALKTDSFDGFQLLQLQDFPGQGTALVGLLNAFWQSKGIISGEKFREFNSEVVPLIRFEKAVYRSGERFEATVEIANFYKHLKNQNIEWSIADSKGHVLDSGNITKDLVIGNNNSLLSIDTLLELDIAQKLMVSVALKGTPYKNSWPIWVYPKVEIPTAEHILVTSSFAVAKSALQEGKKVFLNPNSENIKGIAGRFVPVFWSPVHFPDQPGTMGLLIDEAHPAFNNFPTDNHTDWQWWDLCIKSKSVIIDNTNLQPIVRVIDNFVTNHSLANVFEAKVGTGVLLFSSIDLNSDLENRTVAKQLKYSLLEYMNSDGFKPKQELEWEDIEKLQQQ